MQSQLVDRAATILWDEGSVHVHEDVSDHNHGYAMLGPGRRRVLQEGGVGRVGETLDRLKQVAREAIADPVIKKVAVLVQDQIVSAAVKFLEAERGGIALVDFVYGVPQGSPDLFCSRLVHWHELAPVGLFRSFEIARLVVT